MGRAIDQILEGSSLTRNEVAHAVFVAAREDGEFDAATLATMARERLAAGAMSQPNS
jgi:hypothetical protein